MQGTPLGRLARRTLASSAVLSKRAGASCELPDGVSAGSSSWNTRGAAAHWHAEACDVRKWRKFVMGCKTL